MHVCNARTQLLQACLLETIPSVYDLNPRKRVRSKTFPCFPQPPLPKCPHCVFDVLMPHCVFAFLLMIRSSVVEEAEHGLCDAEQCEEDATHQHQPRHALLAHLPVIAHLGTQKGEEQDEGTQLGSGDAAGMRNTRIRGHNSASALRLKRDKWRALRGPFHGCSRDRQV